MYMLISPAKTLDLSEKSNKNATQPPLLEESVKINAKLKKMSSKALQQLMDISPKIAASNVGWNNDFATPFTAQNSKPALHMFKGDVYLGLHAEDFDQDDLAFAQSHLGILSGLYGLLRPLDLIQAYRLEMGTKLKIGRKKDLYDFWGHRITDLINERSNGIVLNLASNEYFKAVDTQKLKGSLYHFHFKEKRNGQFKIISFHAKKARGMLCRYAIKNKVEKVEDLKSFNMEDYAFNNALSDKHNFVFTR